MKILTSTEGCCEKSHIKYFENTQPKPRTLTWVLKWNLVKYFNILTSRVKNMGVNSLVQFCIVSPVAVHVALHGLCVCCFYLPIIYFCTLFFFIGSLPPVKGIAFPWLRCQQWPKLGQLAPASQRYGRRRGPRMLEQIYPNSIAFSCCLEPLSKAWVLQRFLQFPELPHIFLRFLSLPVMVVSCYS